MNAAAQLDVAAVMVVSSVMTIRPRYYGYAYFTTPFGP